MSPVQRVGCFSAWFKPEADGHLRTGPRPPSSGRSVEQALRVGFNFRKRRAGCPHSERLAFDGGQQTCLEVRGYPRGLNQVAALVCGGEQAKLPTFAAPGQLHLRQLVVVVQLEPAAQLQLHRQRLFLRVR